MKPETMQVCVEGRIEDRAVAEVCTIVCGDGVERVSHRQPVLREGEEAFHTIDGRTFLVRVAR